MDFSATILMIIEDTCDKLAGVRPAAENETRAILLQNLRSARWTAVTVDEALGGRCDFRMTDLVDSAVITDAEYNSLYPETSDLIVAGR